MSVRSFKRAHARRVVRERRRLFTAKRRGALAVGTALSASALFAGNAQAATYTVNSATDDSTGGTCATTCTLRDAISAANADIASDTIRFDPSLAGQTITLSNGALTISHVGGLTITGPGASALAVSGAGASQVLNIDTNPGTSVGISGLTIEDGANRLTNGGAIYNLSNLMLTDDVVKDSMTANSGGGIDSDGPLTLIGTTVSGNTASKSGGGVDVSNVTATITNSTISGNSAPNGGGVAGGRDLHIAGSQVTDNQATDGSGGGIEADGASVSVSATTVSGNTATTAAGGIESDTIYGTTITGSTLSGNAVSGSSGIGGGLEVTGQGGQPNGFAKYNPVHVSTTTISGNTASDGAGVGVAQAAPGTPITIASSTLSGNDGGAQSTGGGLFLAGNIDSPFQLIDSTISGNAATQGGGIGLSNDGAAPLIGIDSMGESGAIDFENATIASNTASGAGGGGGIYLGQYSSGASETSGTVGLESTIVSGNTAAGVANDLARPATSTGGGFDAAFSLIKTPGSAPLLNPDAVIVGSDPQLGPLAANGGPTATMLPSGTSPVIDHGHAPTGLAADQRGDQRTVDVAGVANPSGGDGTDIGAVELPASSVVVPGQPPAGLTASVHGMRLGGANRLLLAGSSTPVTCAVAEGTVSSCLVQVRTTSGTLLATGQATSAGSPTLTVRVTPTAAGRSALARAPLGAPSVATITGNTSRSGSQHVTGNVELLGGASFTLPLVTRSFTLTTTVRSDLAQIAKWLAGGKAATCTAYSDRGTGDVSLTSGQAKTAAGLLKRDGFTGKLTSVGKGHANELAPDTSTANRVMNRRLVITFSF